MNQRKAGLILSYLTMGIQPIIGFVYVPMLLLFLTKQEFGLYQLVGSILSYLVLLDLGLSAATTKYYCEYLVKNDEKGKQNLLATTLIIYCLVSVFVVIAGLILFKFFLPVFSSTFSAEEMLVTKQMFIILLINVCITIVSLVFKAVINSHEKFIFAKLLILINIILQPVIVFFALKALPNLITLVVTLTLCNLAVFLVNIYYCFSKLNIKIKLHSWDKKLVKTIFSFSFFIFLIGIMDQIYWRGGQIVIGAVIGSAAVAIYAIAIQLQMVYAGFSYHINNVFFPYISSLVAKHTDMGELNKLFIKVSRLQTLVAILLFSGFVFYGSNFINFWLGDTFEKAYFCSVILMFAYFIPMSQSMALSIIQAKNKHAFLACIYFAAAVLSLLAAIPLTAKYGEIGCALSSAGAFLTAQCLIGNIYFKREKIDIYTFWNNFFKICTALLPVVIIAYMAEYFIQTSNIFILLIKISLFTAGFGLLIWKIFLNNYEKNLILKPLSLIIKNIKPLNS